MTERQALTEARKRWGKIAYVRKTKPTTHGKKCAVGYVVTLGGLAMAFSVKGQGDNWVEAFANVRP